MLPENETPETTAAAEEATEGGLNFDLGSITGALGDVFGFFQTIIDFLKGIFKPLLESLLGSVLDK